MARRFIIIPPTVYNKGLALWGLKYMGRNLVFQFIFNK